MKSFFPDFMVDGSVPGGVYGDLLTAGILKNGDFYFRYNDVDYRSFSYHGWNYSCTFKGKYKLY